MLDISTQAGLVRCAEAFERLKSGAPIVQAHIGILPSRITAGVVSVEAGFDRGYLKKARPSHAPLIGLIEAFRNAEGARAPSTDVEVRKAKEKAEKASGELEEVRSHLYMVLTQNIQLVERIRVLEEQVKHKKIASIR